MKETAHHIITCKYFKTISNICIKSKCNLVLYVVVLHVFHKFYIVASLLPNVNNLFPKDKLKTVVELLVKKVLSILILYRCLQKLRFWTIFRTVYSCHMFASKQYFGYNVIIHFSKYIKLCKKHKRFENRP